jgi:hypothetical protein
MNLTSFLDRSRTVAEPGYSRWLVPPAALSIHLAIGQAYALSVFNLPMTRLLGITKNDCRRLAADDDRLDLQHRLRDARNLGGPLRQVARARGGRARRSSRPSASAVGPTVVTYVREAQLARGVPKTQAYTVSLYVMAFLLVAGFVCNAAVRAVNARHHIKE